MHIYCCGCKEIIEARMTTGREIYPHRNDLRNLPFWKCDVCNNYVGCHHKTKNRTKPLGNIPTPELRKARNHIHETLDPLWKSRTIKRSELYALISERIGFKYHTANLRTIEEARDAYRIILEIRKDLSCQN